MPNVNFSRGAVVAVNAVRSDRRESRGGGVLIAPRLVLTAFHVVESRERRRPADNSIAVEIGGEARISARVLPTLSDPLQDWALLEIPPQPGASPMPLVGLDPAAEGLPWESLVFTQFAPRYGHMIRGSVRHVDAIYDGVAAYQLACDELRGENVEGVSGCPVVVSGGVAGIFRAAARPERNVGILYACPVKLVVEHVAKLADQGGLDAFDDSLRSALSSLVLRATRARGARGRPSAEEPTAYVVFARIARVAGTELTKAAAEEGGRAMAILQRELSQLTAHSHPSLHGRFAVLTAEPTRALDLAAELMQRAAARGLLLTIGVARGAVREAHNPLSGASVVGDGVNLAARLGFLAGAEGAIVVQEEIGTLAEASSEKFRGKAWSAPTTRTGQVKESRFDYRLVAGEWPVGDRLQASGLEVTLQEAIAVVYDIVGFSKLPLVEQRTAAHAVDVAADEVLRKLGIAPRLGRSLRHVFTGDGGVIVLSGGEQDAAWQIAAGLRSQLSALAMKGRIGVDAGVVAGWEGGDCLTGSAIFDANAASDRGAPGTVTVARSVWDSLAASSRDGWSASSIPGAEAYLCVTVPGEVRGGEPVVERRRTNPNGPLKLTGPQREELIAALEGAFDGVQSFGEFLMGRLDRNINKYAGPNDSFPTALFKVLTGAHKERWMTELVREAALYRIEDDVLVDLARRYHLAPAGEAK